MCATRRNKLQQYREAWNLFKWTLRKSLPHHYNACWEFAGGVVGFSSPDDRSLCFNQIPSDIRGLHEDEWQLGDFSFFVQDFTMDPSQDLLVVIEAEALSQTPEYVLYAFYHVELSMISCLCDVDMEPRSSCTYCRCEVATLITSLQPQSPTPMLLTSKNSVEKIIGYSLYEYLARMLAFYSSRYGDFPFW